MHTNLEPDIAQRFLKLLDPDGGAFTFQTFQDRKGVTKNHDLTCVYSAPTPERLLDLHARGAGIYVTVNKTDGTGRKSKNITHIRAVWREADDPNLPALPIEPSFVVETSPGHKHEYFAVRGDDWSADEQGRTDHAGVMARMVETYGSDENAKDLCRVLRLAGFLHRKTSTPHLVRITAVSGRRYTRKEILEAFPPVAPRKKSAPAPDTQTAGASVGDDIERVRKALAYIPVDNRKDWVMVGMALRSNFGEAGRALWDEWSIPSAKYDEKDQGDKWNSFNSSGTGIGSIIHRARKCGMPDPKIEEEEFLSRLAPPKTGNGHTEDFSEYIEPPKKADLLSGFMAKMFNAADLCTMTFPEIKYVVPGFIAEGLTLFAGKPKIGKSWLLMHMAWAVASGDYTLGGIGCDDGDVLYAALEDNKRRLQRRMTKLFGAASWPRRLTFLNEMPRLAESGIEVIKTWLEGAQSPRLVIIDTLAMVRMPNRKDQNSYDADYSAVKDLRELAAKHHVAIILVHHLRKAEAEDPFDTISGTLGLTGAPDTIMIIYREGGGILLQARGRDIEEIKKAVQFDKGTCTWNIVGDADVVRRSVARSAIIKAMEEAGEPVGPIQVATVTGMKQSNVRQHMMKMKQDGLIENIPGKYGYYRIVRKQGEI